MRCGLIVLLATILLVSCQKTDPSGSLYPSLFETPDHFSSIPFPDDNPKNFIAWALGKRLFYDTALSRDSSLSCASCHLPAFAFSDPKPVSVGIEDRPGTRNTPSLANVAYHPYLLREGGVPTLEMQIAVPVQEHHEFDFHFPGIVSRISQNNEYVQLSRQAYGRDPDAWVITRAIAMFERSLISGSSPFDLFLSGDSDAITLAARKGYALFQSERTSCYVCHGGMFFSNFTFENNGLYAQYTDSGRFRLTGQPEDMNKFKVPSLRNVAITAPYMHDGGFQSLDEVLVHYNLGGYAHPGKHPLIRPLHLSQVELDYIKAFLESLTDPLFYQNPIFKP